MFLHYANKTAVMYVAFDCRQFRSGAKFLNDVIERRERKIRLFLKNLLSESIQAVTFDPN
jgi:hypothetical protein